MANKLFLICATLALCLLLTNASIYRTVVEFDEDVDTNPMGPVGPTKKCQKEFQQAKHLKACQLWIKKTVKQGTFDDEFDLEDDMENLQSGQQQQHPILRQCCKELREEEPVCVCPTLKGAAKAVRSSPGLPGFKAPEIYMTARNLPKVCKIPQVACRFMPTSFFTSSY